MNHKQRKRRHDRRQTVHVKREDKRVALLEECVQKARSQRKGKAQIINLMNKAGYSLRDGGDHTNHADWHQAQPPTLKAPLSK